MALERSDYPVEEAQHMGENSLTAFEIFRVFRVFRG